MNYSFRILSCLIAFIVLDNALIGQYDPENEVVTILKYHLKPLSEVDDGSAAERKEVFEEYARKINPLTTELKMAMTLGHYWSGTSTDVLQINTYESIADADQAGENEAKTRKRAWRRDDVREEFFKKFNKYWQINELNASLLS